MGQDSAVRTNVRGAYYDDRDSYSLQSLPNIYRAVGISSQLHTPRMNEHQVPKRALSSILCFIYKRHKTRNVYDEQNSYFSSTTMHNIELQTVYCIPGETFIYGMHGPLCKTKTGNG